MSKITVSSSVNSSLKTVMEIIHWGGYDSRTAYGMLLTLEDVQTYLKNIETENLKLREALEEIKEFAHTSTKDATWIEERARAALEGK